MSFETETLLATARAEVLGDILCDESLAARSALVSWVAPRSGPLKRQPVGIQ